MPKLSVVIPCFNEAESIPILIDRLSIAFSNKEIEVILVNNGSNDESESVLNEMLVEHPVIKYINLEKNMGYGGGILAGLKIAKGDVLGWTHADLQTDPSDILHAFELYKKHDSNQILIKGARKNRDLGEYFVTIGMQTVASILLGVELVDINAQPKLFGKNIYKMVLSDNPPNDFSLDLYLLYKAQKFGYQIRTFPVQFKKRLYGQAKGGGAKFLPRAKTILKTFGCIIKLKFE